VCVNLCTYIHTCMYVYMHIITIQHTNRPGILFKNASLRLYIWTTHSCSVLERPLACRCVSIYVYVCIRTCMYVYLNDTFMQRLGKALSVQVRVYLCVCMYTYMYVCISERHIHGKGPQRASAYVCMYASMYTYMYVCMRTCMYVCISERHIHEKGV
jgi:hypothetical protein